MYISNVASIIQATKYIKQHHTNGSASNLGRPQPKAKVKTDNFNEFLFTDDCALNATIKANIQNIVNKFSIACDKFSQTIRRKKTELMY